MENPDQPISKPIGTYSANTLPFFLYDGTFTIHVPIYAIRKHYLEMVRKTFTQVMILNLGEMAWINVDDKDISLLKEYVDFVQATERKQG